MHSISVKELRENFPLIRSELKKGQSFLIIYKSKPLAELNPTHTILHKEKDDEENFNDWQNAGAQDVAEHIPPTTKEEYDYYMSLPPLSKK